MKISEKIIMMKLVISARNLTIKVATVVVASNIYLLLIFNIIRILEFVTAQKGYFN